MHTPAWVKPLLMDRLVRTVFAVLAAAGWYVLSIAGDIGWSSFILVSALPAALVLVWWRTRPLLALGLAVASLVLMLWGAGNGISVGAGGVVAGSAAWFAVLGSAVTGRSALLSLSGGLVGLIAVVSLLNNGAPSAFAVLLAGATALLLGWGWRQAAGRSVLGDELHETTERSRAAERDVLLELERNRLAREVHDVVAHSLAVVIAQADGARFAAGTKPESVAPALEAISDTARRALGEVRTMLHDLRTSGEAGVVPGADDLAGLVEGVRGLGVQVDEVVYGQAGVLERASGLALYRVAQEALTNAMRHGDRERPVGFEVDWGEREVVLVVTNAVPADAVPASERTGHGVTGMRERAADAGGDCTAGIGSNGRFRVRVALPITPRPRGQEAPPTAPDGIAALLGTSGARA